MNEKSTNEEKREKSGIKAKIAQIYDMGAIRLRPIFNTVKKAAASYTPRSLFRGLAIGFAAFLLGMAEIYFGAIPLGVAFLCAAPTGIQYIVAGLFIAALVRGDAVVAGAFIVIVTVLIRIVVRVLIEPVRGRRVFSEMFTESTYLRMATAAVAGFALGMYRLINGGFYLYDLAGCITESVVAPVAVALYMPLWKKNHDQLPDTESVAGKVMNLASYHALVFSLALAAANINVTGMSAIHIAATALTLYTVRRRGLAEGIAAGTLCGAVAGWTAIPLYVLGAATSYLFMNLSLLAAATSLPLCGAVWCAVFSGAEGFITLFPSQVAGLAFFCVVSLVSERMDYSAAVKETEAAEPLESRERMRELSDAFAGLADSFSELARTRRRPSVSELRRACDRVCDKVCLKCRNRNLCWNLEYASTLDVIGKICTSVEKRGYAEIGDLPQYMRKRCSSLEVITDGVNEAATKLLRECLEDERLAGFGADYRAVSAALTEAVSEDIRENREDSARTERVRRVLDIAGVKYSALSVRGERKVYIKAEGAELRSTRLSAGELRRRLERACGVKLSPPMLVSNKSGTVLELCTRRKYEIRFGAARSGAETGESCGDSICHIDTDDDYFYAVICDGMGQGNDAAFASGAAVGFLMRMLSARMSVETSLSVLNAWLRADRNECSVSIDILRVDLLSGKAAIYKSGAAPTYLRRGRDVYPIESEGFPVGILTQTSAVRTDLELCGDDVILMGSDGIDPDGKITGGEQVWLLDILEAVDTDSADPPALTAQRVVRSARLAGSSDDICAVVIYIADKDQEPERPV